jgi:uncharacterized integral membrane protein
MKALKTVLFGLLFVVLITFSMKNAGNVRFKYFDVIDSFEAPLSLLVLLSILLGMLVGAMVDLIMRRQLKKAIRRQQQIMDELQKELIALRRVILVDSMEENGKQEG